MFQNLVPYRRVISLLVVIAGYTVLSSSAHGNRPSANTLDKPLFVPASASQVVTCNKVIYRSPCGGDARHSIACTQRWVITQCSDGSTTEGPENSDSCRNSKPTGDSRRCS
jgi:hypothetical protein